MKPMIVLLALVLLAGLALFGWTRLGVHDIERRFPPVGQFAGPPDARTHYVDVARGQGFLDHEPAAGASLPPMLLLHGASANLLDQLHAHAPGLIGRGRLVAVDRPGHGYSDRGDAETPLQQADRYVALLDEIGIDRTIVICHSLGCASAAALAVAHPERVLGLVFLAPATHPWPGGVTWYYDIGSMAGVSYLFTETLVYPVGNASLQAGVESVFAPDEPPQDYAQRAAIPLAFRPATFRANSRDVARLNDFVRDFAPRYREITAPTVIVTGDTDGVVAPSIHSVGLERDIKGAELVVLPRVGHKPDYAARDVVVAAVEKVAERAGATAD